MELVIGAFLLFIAAVAATILYDKHKEFISKQKLNKQKVYASAQKARRSTKTDKEEIDEMIREIRTKLLVAKPKRKTTPKLKKKIVGRINARETDGSISDIQKTPSVLESED